MDDEFGPLDPVPISRLRLDALLDALRLVLQHMEAGEPVPDQHIREIRAHYAALTALVESP